MEFANHKVFTGFLKESEKSEVVSFVDSINEKITLEDHHLKYLVNKINGSSYMYDIGKTELTGPITAYQSGGAVMKGELPSVFHQLCNRISKKVGVSSKHAFLQIVDMNTGGSIDRHYDAAFPGYINYKCNISVLSKDYDFVIDGRAIQVKESDMYCFEASLYKHWTPQPFNSRRILLSFGFMLSYKELRREESDPRVRMSKRIQKKFQF